MDGVHPPEGHALRCALGYTSMDGVHPPEGHELRCALGDTFCLCSLKYNYRLLLIDEFII